MHNTIPHWKNKYIKYIKWQTPSYSTQQMFDKGLQWWRNYSNVAAKIKVNYNCCCFQGAFNQIWNVKSDYPRWYCSTEKDKCYKRKRKYWYGNSEKRSRLFPRLARLPFLYQLCYVAIICLYEYKLAWW